MPSKDSKIYIIMGVSASGKTTLGKVLAAKLNLQFLDGDDFHPPENIAKMSAGIPLQDSDRYIWLNRLNLAAKANKNNGAVIACSALKESYRNILSEGFEAQIVWIVLHGTFEFVQARIQDRKDHFMPPGLLKSQFDTLELPPYGIHLPVTLSPEEMLREISKTK
ncbi:MAG: hypothetical protein RLZZ241_2421 [Bacteroidota bacterium]|jgi:gluconokinase